MSRYIDAEPWESMGASVKFEYPNKCDDTLIGHIMIQDIHTADVAPVVHGRWVFETATANTLSMIKCDICGWWTLDPSVDNSYKYCPNCGAKMDGSEIGETN